jgi:hypothetical protein
MQKVSISVFCPLNKRYDSGDLWTAAQSIKVKWIESSRYMLRNQTKHRMVMAGVKY